MTYSRTEAWKEVSRDIHGTIAVMATNAGLDVKDAQERFRRVLSGSVGLDSTTRLRPERLRKLADRYLYAAHELGLAHVLGVEGAAPCRPPETSISQDLIQGGSMYTLPPEPKEFPVRTVERMMLRRGVSREKTQEAIRLLFKAGVKRLPEHDVRWLAEHLGVTRTARRRAPVCVPGSRREREFAERQALDLEAFGTRRPPAPVVALELVDEDEVARMYGQEAA